MAVREAAKARPAMGCTSDGRQAGKAGLNQQVRTCSVASSARTLKSRLIERVVPPTAFESFDAFNRLGVPGRKRKCN